MTYSGCTESTTLLSAIPEELRATGDNDREALENAHRYALTWSTDHHSHPLRWRVEQEDPQRTAIQAEPERLTLESAAGLTLWLDAPLAGTYRIAFVREVLIADGPHDRLSDFNQFWAARDPASANLFTRHGQLSEYDNLDLYYVGMGGNWNSTTRFRYYNGQGEREILGEYTDADHLLRPNHRYQVVIEVDRYETRFLVDDALYFRAAYPAPPAPGHFGFRTVYSRQAISDFTVTPL